MTDTAFIFALTLGAVVLVGMLWVSHAASTRLSYRLKQRAYASSHSDNEPDLFDVTDDQSAELANRELRKRIRETVR